MAKRRILKKGISYDAGDLFSEAIIAEQYIPNVDHEKVEQLMTRILDVEDDFICRAHRPDGKDNPKLVKAYYKKLKEDVNTEFMAIADELLKLHHEKKEEQA